MNLSFAQLTFVSDTAMYVVLVDSKGAKFKGQPENICIKDVMLLAALRRLCNDSQAYDLVSPCTYNEVQVFSKEAASYFWPAF